MLKRTAYVKYCLLQYVPMFISTWQGPMSSLRIYDPDRSVEVVNGLNSRHHKSKNRDLAESELDNLEDKWNDKYPKVIRSRRNNRERLSQ